MQRLFLSPLLLFFAESSANAELCWSHSKENAALPRDLHPIAYILFFTLWNIIERKRQREPEAASAECGAAHRQLVPRCVFRKGKRELGDSSEALKSRFAYI